MKRITTPILVVLLQFLLTAMHAAEPRPSLPIYQPTVKLADIYFHHPGAKPALRHNHGPITDDALFSVCGSAVRSFSMSAAEAPILSNRDESHRGDGVPVLAAV